MGVKLVSFSGGSVELNAPSTASTFTITAPARNGTLGTEGPLFLASTSGLSVPNATLYTVPGNVWNVSYDVGLCFNASTGRFTPNVPGYYYFFGVYDTGGNGTTTCTAVGSNVYINGAGTAITSSIGVSGTNFLKVVCSGIWYANGTTDYFQLVLFQNTGGNNTNVAGKFGGGLLRGQ